MDRSKENAPCNALVILERPLDRQQLSAPERGLTNRRLIRSAGRSVRGANARTFGASLDTLLEGKVCFAERGQRLLLMLWTAPTRRR